MPLTYDELIEQIQDVGFCVLDGRIYDNPRKLPTRSEVSAITAGDTPLGLAGLYNWPNGMARYFNGFGEIGAARAGTGLGGLDIVAFTDSWMSYAAESLRSSTMIAKIRNGVQGKYNPILRADGSNYGGPGLINCIGGDNNTPWTVSDPVDAAQSRVDAGCSYEGTSVSFTDLNYPFMRWTNAATDRRCRWTFAGGGTYAVRNRDRITGAELLATQASSYGTLRLDQKTDGDAYVAIAGSVGTIAAAGSTFRAKHWGQQWSGLTPGNTNCIQVGSPSSAAQNDLMGLIGYCNDWDTGIRVHHIGNPGVRLADWYGAGVATPTDYVTGVITGFTASAPGSAAAGATRAKLFISNLLLNDVAQFNGSTFTPEAFEAQVTAFVNAVRVQPSLPCVLWVIPPAGSSAARIAHYPDYVRAIKRVMNANLDIMTVFDFGEYLGDGVDGAFAGASDAGFLTTNNWRIDGSHLTQTGHDAAAKVLMRLL
jgi:hypothetical protein